MAQGAPSATEDATGPSSVADAVGGAVRPPVHIGSDPQRHATPAQSRKGTRETVVNGRGKNDDHARMDKPKGSRKAGRQGDAVEFRIQQADMMVMRPHHGMSFGAASVVMAA